MQNDIVIANPTVTEASTSEPQPERLQCRHIRAIGTRCPKAALPGEHFCFNHHASRRPIPRPVPRYPDADREPFAFPIVEDRASIQLAISQILTRVAANDLDPKRAGLLLYGLQIAAQTLPRDRNTTSTPTSDDTMDNLQPATDNLVADPDHGLLAPITPWDPALANPNRRPPVKSFAQELYEILSDPPVRPDPNDADLDDEPLTIQAVADNLAPAPRHLITSEWDRNTSLPPAERRTLGRLANKEAKMNFRSFTRIHAGAAAILLTSSIALAQMQPGGAPPIDPTVPQSPTHPGAPPAPLPPDTVAPPSSAAPSSYKDPANPMLETRQAADKTFVKKALDGGASEIELGKLAEQKSSSDDVKRFGERMVTDHTKLGNQMKSIAETLGVEPSKQLPQKEKDLIARLQNLPADQFDRAYIQSMVEDHQQDLKDFQDEARSTQDPNVKQAATEGISVITEHLKLAQQMAQNHNIELSELR